MAILLVVLLFRSTKAQERVHLPGTKKVEPFEVYSQGMFKTELCNKWQETGTCPYGDNCQFAHGIAELRPVIRHPRYKTEVCRMVLAGDSCPYGHRCHFRHSLTEQETVLPPRWLKKKKTASGYHLRSLSVVVDRNAPYSTGLSNNSNKGPRIKMATRQLMGDRWIRPLERRQAGRM